MRAELLAWAALGAAGVAACGTDVGWRGSPVRTSKSAIIGGTVSGPEDDAVVHVHGPGADPELDSVDLECTGTLVARNLVLTALHCVSYFDPVGIFVCRPDGSLSEVDPGAGRLSGQHDPAKIAVRVGQDLGAEPSAYGSRIFSLRTSNVCQNDLAFVVLDRELEAPVKPVRLEAGVVPNELVRVVGYGSSFDGSAIQRRTRSGVPVTRVGQNEYWQGAALIPDNTFELGPSVCPGDSGGPALSEGGDAVLGVSSHSNGACTADSVRNFFVQLAPYAELAREAFDAAGAEPWLEGQPAPGWAGAGRGGGATAGAGGGGAGERPGSAGAAGAENARPRDAGECACRAAGQPKPQRGVSWLSLAATGAVLVRRGRRRGMAS